MSSFTIDKKEYIKVAGFIAGIAESYSRGCREFWVYDRKAGKNTDKDLYYKRFTQCYEMNAASVRGQYHGAEVGADGNNKNEYKKEFEEYYRKGKTVICQSADFQRQAVAEIRNFFHSALYQTEDEKYNFIMTHWFNIILDQLVEHLIIKSYDAQSWGSFELPESERNIQLIG